MKDFQASNGYRVSFISRYKGECDYRLERGTERLRITIPDRDLGEPRAQYTAITTEHLQAYNEYAIEENRRFQEWRKQNHGLLADLMID